MRKFHNRATDNNANSKAFRNGILEAFNISDIEVFDEGHVTFLAGC